MVKKTCRHERIWFDRRSEAFCRIEAYNRLVDTVKEDVGIFIKNFDIIKKPLRKIIRNYGFGDIIILFMDNNQLDEYWVGISQDGNFYDGWDCYVGEKIDRQIKLDHIDSMEDVAWSDAVYSTKDNGDGCFLDYNTLLAIRNCLKIGLPLGLTNKDKAIRR